MTRQRALIVFPGRGSYSRDSLGCLQGRSPRAQEILTRCEELRAQVGRPSLHELDGAPSFRSSLHLAGEHASLLTCAASLCDLAELDRDRFEIVGICGNSMGWYGALSAAGALPLDDALALVETMAGYQAQGVIGGQLLYPLKSEEGSPDPSLLSAVEHALDKIRERGGQAYWSIRLGTHAVIGADALGLDLLSELLPPVKRGARSFPLRLPLHAAFHTPLLQSTSERAQVELRSLRFQAPTTLLIDGRGVVHRTRWADPQGLRDYTLGAQVTQTYDFVLGLRTALATCGPDVVIALGPGNSLGGPILHTLLDEGWRGARDKASFLSLQESEHPALLSFGVPEQRSRLLRPA